MTYENKAKKFLTSFTSVFFVFAILMTHGMAPEKYDELLKIGSVRYQKKYSNEVRTIPSVKRTRPYDSYFFSVPVSKRVGRIRTQQLYSNTSYNQPGHSFRQVATYVAVNNQISTPVQ